MWLTDAQSQFFSSSPFSKQEPPKKKNNTSPLPISKLTRDIICFAEIGVALTTFGGLFMFLGVILFFDGALLALGNVRFHSSSSQQQNHNSNQPQQILFVSGLTLIIGPQKTFYFFARKQKLRGTVCFIGGILLVFFKRPFIGMLIETFGFLNLFGYVQVLHTLRPLSLRK